MRRLSRIGELCVDWLAIVLALGLFVWLVGMAVVGLVKR
jgi:hypothetical protein